MYQYGYITKINAEQKNSSCKNILTYETIYIKFKKCKLSVSTLVLKNLYQIHVEINIDV